MSLCLSLSPSHPSLSLPTRYPQSPVLLPHSALGYTLSSECRNLLKMCVTMLFELLKSENYVSFEPWGSKYIIFLIHFLCFSSGRSMGQVIDFWIDTFSPFIFSLRFPALGIMFWEIAWTSSSNCSINFFLNNFLILSF